MADENTPQETDSVADTSSTKTSKSTADTKGSTPPVPPAAKKKAAAQAKSKKVSRTPIKIGTPRWVVPTMLALFIIGMAWIVAYYVDPNAAIFAPLGWWNVVVGFVFMAAGFVVSTKWK